MEDDIDKQVCDLMGVEEPTREAKAALLRQLTEDNVRRMRDEQYRFYIPNGKCEQFINTVGSGEWFITLFSAANGVGKTQAGANVVAHFLFGEQSDNEWFKARLFKNWPYTKRGRIVSDPGNLNSIVAALGKWFPAGEYTATKGKKDYLSQWRTKDGWIFDIMSYEQDAKEFEGETLGWVWFDEPPTEAIYKACIARLRMGGVMFITATMLKGSAWLYDKLVVGEVEVEGVNGEKITRKVANIEADVEAACIQHGTRGHLEHEQINAMVAEYDPDEREARVHGRFQHLTGLVYKQFKRKVHVIPAFDINMADWVVYEALDPHPRNPDAVVWIAVDRYGTCVVCNELYAKPKNGSRELAELIKAKADRYRIQQRIADPSGWNTNQNEDDSRGVCQKLTDYDLNYIKASKNREAADKRIGDFLGFVQLPTGEFIQSPRLLVFDTCKRTIFEFEHYQWEDWTGKTADKKDPREKPMDKDDHMIENIGRILLLEPGFVEMPAAYEYGQQDNPLTDVDPYA